METLRELDALRNEMNSRFDAMAVRIGATENELHRHQDDCREDKRQMREALAEITNQMAEWTGSIKAMKYTLTMTLGIPAVVAAVASIISLVRHW